MKKTILICCILLLLTGCQNFPEDPSGPKDNLLIGKITLEAKGFKMISNDITYKNNISITIENVKTEKQYKLKTNRYGVFYKNNLKPGSYKLKKLLYAKESDNGYSRIGAPINGSPITIQPGKVINLGSIKWITNNESMRSKIRKDKSAEEFYEFLLSKYPESKWFERKWVHLN